MYHNRDNSDIQNSSKDVFEGTHTSDRTTGSSGVLNMTRFANVLEFDMDVLSAIMDKLNVLVSDNF